jgi:hypothetical protein
VSSSSPVPVQFRSSSGIQSASASANANAVCVQGVGEGGKLTDFAPPPFGVGTNLAVPPSIYMSVGSVPEGRSFWAENSVTLRASYGTPVLGKQEDMEKKTQAIINTTSTPRLPLSHHAMTILMAHSCSPFASARQIDVVLTLNELVAEGRDGPLQYRSQGAADQCLQS